MIGRKRVKVEWVRAGVVVAWAQGLLDEREKVSMEAVRQLKAWAHDVTADGSLKERTKLIKQCEARFVDLPEGVENKVATSGRLGYLP